jgi:hypothetical protein
MSYHYEFEIYAKGVTIAGEAEIKDCGGYEWDIAGIGDLPRDSDLYKFINGRLADKEHVQAINDMLDDEGFYKGCSYERSVA